MLIALETGMPSADKIISASHRYHAENCVIVTVHAVRDFLNGAVSAAGIDAGLLSAPGGLLRKGGAVAGLPRNADLIIQSSTAAERIDRKGKLRSAVRFARSRVHHKQMPHARPPPLRYWKRLHWIMPL